MTEKDTKYYIGYVIIAVGLFASNLICKLIVCTLAKKEYDYLQIEVLLACIFPVLIRIMPLLILKKALVIVFFLAAFGFSGIYSYQIVNKIAHVLNIKTLTV